MRNSVDFAKRPSCVIVLAVLAAQFAVEPAVAQEPQDPFLWLEEIESDSAMAWVEAHNAETMAKIGEDPQFDEIRERTLAILNSDDRIADPSIRGDRLTNYWQDAENPRGIWRRTTWESYLSGEPEWEVVLDIDSLAAAEDVPWSYHGATCLPPEDRHCLVRLSRGGADAVEIREFDTVTKQFVDDGFFLAEAKQGVAWVDHDALLVATDFGLGSMTTSGYPRIAKLWRRGTPLEQAVALFEGDETDVAVWVGSIRTADGTVNVVAHRPRFFEGTVYVLRDTTLAKLDLPLDSDMGMVGDRLVVYLRSSWEVGGATYPAGSLIATGYDNFLAGNREFQLVVRPGERETIEGFSSTRDHLMVNMLNDVRGELRRYRFEGGEWIMEPVPAPDFGSIDIAATSPYTNRFFFTFEGFTQPTTLYLAEADGRVREVRRLPAMFDAEGLVVEQHEATSKDGTRVPYFVVRHQGAEPDGMNPTLLYGYGGFEISLTPSYNAVTGANWLERGGTYAVANIRGGGEFGPEWHRAAMKENRQRAYDDFIAVAEDLIARGITSPEHLGIMGGSNGGLLMGVMLTQRPDLFGAVVIRNPLFDMLRYHLLLAGASWMAEYGNPDIPEERAYIAEYSPYQNLRAEQDYPGVFFTTTTRDDRVHPGHARKGAAKMEALEYPVLFYENTEGGHGAGVTNEQRARILALRYTYLWTQIGAPVGGPASNR